MRSILAIVALLPFVWAIPNLASAQEPYYQPTPRPYYGQVPVVVESGDLALAAHELSESASNLYRMIRSVTGYSHLANDALNLARSAERFHQGVEGAAPNERAVYRDFMRLSGEYHQLRGQFYRAHRTHHIPQVVNNWTRMVNDYERLALEMGVEDQRSACTYVPRATYGRTYRFEIR